MWINPLFSAEVRDALRDLARSSSLATLVAEGPLRAAHMPVLVEEDEAGELLILGHIPRADPLSKAIQEGQDILCIFHGPRAYVSAGWYEKVGLSTYNYSVAHLRGRSEEMSEEDLESHLTQLIKMHEQNKEPSDGGEWQFDEAAQARFEILLPKVLGYRIRVSDAQAKEKIGQNRSAEDRAMTVTQLAESSQEEHLDMADLMKKREER